MDVVHLLMLIIGHLESEYIQGTFRPEHEVLAYTLRNCLPVQFQFCITKIQGMCPIFGSSWFY